VKLIGEFATMSAVADLMAIVVLAQQAVRAVQLLGEW
jgi:hypothetical protein